LDKTIFAKAMSKFNIGIHVMNMKEFMQFIGYAKENRDIFDYYPVQRIENFVENPSVINQSEFVENKY
jgi:hypothetical protein